jgi:hypothetical protein
LKVSCQSIDIKPVVNVGSVSDVGGDMVMPSVSVDVLPSVDLLLPDVGNKFVPAPSVLDNMPVIPKLLSNLVPADRDVPSSFEQAPLSLERDYSTFPDDLADLDVYIDMVDACDLYDDDFCPLWMILMKNYSITSHQLFPNMRK